MERDRNRDKPDIVRTSDIESDLTQQAWHVLVRNVVARVLAVGHHQPAARFEHAGHLQQATPFEVVWQVVQHERAHDSVKGGVHEG